MPIPFLNLFKRKPEKVAPVEPAPASPPPKPVEKPSGERLSKTVMPNSTRNFSVEPSFSSSSARAGATAVAPMPSVRAPFSLGGGGAGAVGLPPAVALALEPKIERAISLDLAEVVQHLPEGLVRPLQEGDANRRVLLKAAELEQGMATGNPAVSLTSIHKQVPEIFLKPVTDNDTREVPLPFDKVLEQFSKLKLRDDQYRDQVVPQVETPFLQLTVEDNTRFGIPMEPIQTGELPPVRMQLATAEAIAAAHPEAAFLERVVVQPPPRQLTPLRMPAPPPPKEPVVSRAPAPPEIAPPPPAAPTPPATPPPARIPFSLTPNGTDAPTPERVPASSGPSVPTSMPLPHAPAQPKRVPFSLSPSGEETPAKTEPWLTKETFEGAGETAAAEPMVSSLPKPAPIAAPGSPQSKIALPLKPILQNLPPFQLAGDLAIVPEDAKVEVPFALVEPQLITGRVSLQPEQFSAALPEAYSGLFSAKEIDAPVALPLQDVLKNLPSTALRMRDDQVTQQIEGNFATPFAAKAEEDAKRFGSTSAPMPPAIAPPETAQAKTDLPKIETPQPAPIAKPKVAMPATPEIGEEGRTALREIFETDEDLDAKGVVAHLSKMPGVKACTIMFADGLTLAGSFPEEYAADGLCAMGPSFLQRVEGHLAETKLGALRALTLSCADAAVTFFVRNNLCLAALHAPEGLAADLRERIGRGVEELSRKYSHPV